MALLDACGHHIACPPPFDIAHELDRANGWLSPMSNRTEEASRRPPHTYHAM